MRTPPRSTGWSTARSTVSFFVSYFKAGTGPALHRHPYEETFIIESGDALFTVGDESVAVNAGDVLVPAGVPHTFIAGENNRQISIHPVARMETEWL